MNTDYNDIANALRGYYDKDADRRNAESKADWKLTERDHFLSLLNAEGKTRFLEVGAGTGEDAAFFQQAGLKVTATDLSSRMVELCRERGLDAHQADFLSIDFGETRFDALFGMNCLLHVPRDELPKILAHFAALMTEDALMYMGLYGGRDETEFRDGPFGRRLFVSYTDESLKDHFSRHFRIERFNRIDFDHYDFPDCYQSIIARKT
jgi:SAM-dependent methyltransferase